MTISPGQGQNRGVAQRDFSVTRKYKNAILNIVTNPFNVLTVLSIVLLAYLIVIPLVEMIFTTFELAPREARRIGMPQTAGGFTLYYWSRLLVSRVSRSLLWRPLLNSLAMASCVSVLSILVGSVIAWLMVRSDLPGKKFLSLIMIVPYMLPSWTKSMAWRVVFKNSRVGGQTGFLASLGIDVPNWLAYGPIPIVIVLTVHYYTYAYLLVSAALSSLNSELEEMGEISGASKIQILKKITMPLVLPAILSSFILTFSKTIGTFGVPAFLGMSVNFYTISTMLYSTAKQGEANTGYAIACILIIISSIFIYLNQKAIGSRKSFATITGKGGHSNPIRLGKFKYFIVTLLWLFILCGVVGPIIILTIDTFMLKRGVYAISNFSLHFWTGKSIDGLWGGTPGVLANPLFWTYLWNTVKLVVLTSVIAGVAGQITGYIISRSRGKWTSKLIEQLAFIPYLIPSIAFGAIYLSMFAARHLFIPSLYGTFALLVLVSAVKHLPFSCRSGVANMMQISVELEEAAGIAGSSFIRRLTRIVIPLSKGGLFSGIMLIFISIIKELDLLIMIITPKMKTLSILAYEYASENFDPYANVVAVIMFLMVFAVYWFANRFGKADIAKSMG
ncbi:MAG: iron ABC transporter permease [Spirochaetales bacterium]|jgi:iron(III) transport system permease protein|nr:iron ABC transporter permease [Spirochaetales bacterium]